MGALWKQEECIFIALTGKSNVTAKGKDYSLLLTKV